MRITAKADYAVRAALELAAAPEGPVKADRIAVAQGIPLKFLENILGDMRTAGLVRSQRGPEGGYWLARPASEVHVGEVIRAVEGPLASVRGAAPEEVAYEGPAGALQDVWIAVRANLRAVLDEVTLAQVADASLPDAVRKLTAGRDAWLRR